jgi:hypothetical protein
MAMQGVIRVAFDDVFPHGAWLAPGRVEPARDFKRSSREVEVQEVVRDAAGEPVLVDGEQQRVWHVDVIDGDESVSGEATRVRVKIVSVRQPVPPPPVPGTPFRPVILEGLSVRAWVNTDRCKVEANRPHRCGARQAWSFWATGLRPGNPAATAEAAKAGAGNARAAR